MFKRGSTRKEVAICLGQWIYMLSVLYLLIVFDWHLAIFLILLSPAIVISIRSYVLMFIDFNKEKTVIIDGDGKEE